MTSAVNSTETSTLTEQFESLARQWKAETALLSATPLMVAHPAYQAIIGLGWGVVPLLLRDLERDSTHWFEALQAITGEDPVSPPQWGNIRAMTEAWLTWGRNHGLV